MVRKECVSVYFVVHNNMAKICRGITSTVSARNWLVKHNTPDAKIVMLHWIWCLWRKHIVFTIQGISALKGYEILFPVTMRRLKFHFHAALFRGKIWWFLSSSSVSRPLVSVSIVKQFHLELISEEWKNYISCSWL